MSTGRAPVRTRHGRPAPPLPAPAGASARSHRRRARFRHPPARSGRWIRISPTPPPATRSGPRCSAGCGRNRTTSTPHLPPPGPSVRRWSTGRPTSAIQGRCCPAGKNLDTAPPWPHRSAPSARPTSVPRAARRGAGARHPQGRPPPSRPEAPESAWVRREHLSARRESGPTAPRADASLLPARSSMREYPRAPAPD